MSKKELSREPYKGTRDFYPEDMAFEKWLFSHMRKVCESFGYVEYSASVLESTELYAAKTGEEIVNEQTYTFEDRGGRMVTLRPEMTPTIARMIAAKRRELALPIRWYSIPNLFRYENPQRGRLREHYQLNVDLFGLNGTEAELEIIFLANKLMFSLGAKEGDFVIKINSVETINLMLEYCKVSKEEGWKFLKLLDKKPKISPQEYQEKELAFFDNDENKRNEFRLLLDEFREKFRNGEISNESSKTMQTILEGLQKENINFDLEPWLTRGFDYYTGMIFEVYDTNAENPRSIFGGGRFDELLTLFGEESIPAVGFGMGDVTARDFLQTHNLLPSYVSPISLMIVGMEEVDFNSLNKIAQNLREKGLNVAVDFTKRKIGDQIKAADKQKIKHIIVIGPDELNSESFTLKKLETGEEKKLSLEEISRHLKN